MKNYFYLLLLCLPMALTAQKQSKATSVSFEVNGNCEQCKHRIEKAGLALKGVKMIRWEIPTHQLSLIYDPNKVELDKIHKAIAAMGYDTDRFKAKDSIYNSLPMCCLYDRSESELQ